MSNLLFALDRGLIDDPRLRGSPFCYPGAAANFSTLKFQDFLMFC